MGARSDRELYLAACTGDREAFRALAERHHGYTLRLSAGLVPDRQTAEDVAHKAWLNVCQHIKKVEDGERAPLKLEYDASFLSWLKTVTTNVATDEHRRQARYQTEEVQDDDIVDNPEMDARLLLEEQRGAVWRAFKQISDQCRDLLLFLIQDPPLSYEAVAEAIDRPVGSIGPMRARCLAQLRARL